MKQTLRERSLEEFAEWKSVLFVCVVLNILAYGTSITNMSYAPDDYGYILSEVNNTAHGRWFADFLYNGVFQKCFMPAFSSLCSILFFTLTGIGLCRFWGIKKESALLVVSLFSLHPYLLDSNNFQVAKFNYALGYAMMMAGLLLLKKGRLGFMLSICCIYLSLSTYQPVLGLAIAAVMVQVLLMTYRENFSVSSLRECGRLLLRYGAVLILSLIIYVMLTKLILVVFDVPVNSRIQAGFLSTVEQLRAKIAVVGSVLLVRVGPVREFVLPFMGKLVIFIVYLLAMLGLILKKSVRLRSLWGLLWIALIPLGAISFVLPLQALAIPWRICLGLVVFFVGMFVLTQESDSLLIRRSGMALGGFLVVYFIFNSNAILYQQHLVNQRDWLMANRIISRVQTLEEYKLQMPLAIVGHTATETFTKEGKSDAEIIKAYIHHTSERRYSLARSAFETDWSKYSILLKYLQAEVSRAGNAQIQRATQQAAGRQPWPAPSSVFIQDDVAVVILSLPEQQDSPAASISDTPATPGTTNTTPTTSN